MRTGNSYQVGGARKAQPLVNIFCFEEPGLSINPWWIVARVSASASPPYRPCLLVASSLVISVSLLTALLQAIMRLFSLVRHV
jgi:hypothetical protein